MDGKMVYQTTAGNLNYTIDLSGIVKGLYVAQVTNVNGVITQKWYWNKQNLNRLY